MAAADFAPSLTFTLDEEGGLADNPNDPGGLTNKGITIAVFLTYYPELGPDDLRNITDIQAATIYRAKYWDLMGCDNLPPGIDLMVFDFGVNAGPSRSVSYLEVVAGTVQDGEDGPITEAAVAKMSPTDVISRLSGLQRAHYRALPTFNVFGTGWLARTDRRVTASHKMIPTTRLTS